MGTRRFAGPVAVALVVALLGILSTSHRADAAGTRETALHDHAITVGSFDFAESELLAEIYSQTLEHNGFRVRRAFRLGPREFVAPAFRGGLLELVPEYAGTALQFVSLGSVRPGPDLVETRAALVHALAGESVVVLDSAPAQDANAFAVSRATADRYNIRTLTDLAAVASRLTFGGSPECESRPLCLVGLQRVYGITFDEFVALDASGPLTHEALRDRVIDVALLFTTDPAIEQDDLVALADDRNLQPAENITPLVRTEVLDRFGPRLASLVNTTSARLTTDKLRDLNAQVADGRRARAVAARFLAAEGLQ